MIFKETQNENYAPSDPKLPSPSGGFMYITYKCKTVKIEANKDNPEK